MRQNVHSCHLKCTFCRACSETTVTSVPLSWRYSLRLLRSAAASDRTPAAMVAAASESIASKGESPVLGVEVAVDAVVGAVPEVVVPVVVVPLVVVLAGVVEVDVFVALLVADVALPDVLEEDVEVFLESDVVVPDFVAFDLLVSDLVPSGFGVLGLSGVSGLSGLSGLVEPASL